MKKPLNSCSECSSEEIFHYDPFNFGNLLDEHMDIEINDEELNEKLQRAMDMLRKFGGLIPGDIEDELNHFTKPKLTWQDFVRFLKSKRKQAGKHNNWNSPQRKPLFSGLYVPKKTDYIVKFLLAYDCSGSMTKEQITYGISQIQALSDRGEGFCLPWDIGPNFESMVRIKNANYEELKNAKFKGGGGTVLSPVFKLYEKEIGPVDIIVIISDFHLADEEDLRSLNPPHNTDVVWLSVTGNSNFTPPFGRIFRLMND